MKVKASTWAAISLACALPAFAAMAQTAPAAAPRPVAPVTIKQLRDNVYAALGGAGGVSGVVVGDKALV